MVRRLVLLVFAATTALASWSCGSNPQQVSGDWNGIIAPFHFNYFVIRISQDGKVLRGTACSYTPGSGTTFVIFRDATVSGSYPTIKVFAPTYQGGWTFEGEFQDDGTLTGRYHSATNPGGYMMALGRTVEAPVNTCLDPSGLTGQD